MRCLPAVVVTAVLFAQSPVRPDVQLPAEAAGWDNVVAGLLSVLDRVDVLALGEAHGRQVDAELRLRLVRDPRFARKVHTIVVELPVADQALFARYSQGGDVSAIELQRLWSPANPPYGGLFEAVHDINRASQSPVLQVITNQTPTGVRDRNTLAVSAIRERIAKGDKVLVVYGAGHVWHREGGVTDALDRVLPGRVFVAEVLAPVFVRESASTETQQLDASLRALEDTVSSRDRPVMISLMHTRAAALAANPFYLGQAMLPPSTTIGDLDDACVYFGR